MTPKGRISKKNKKSSVVQLSRFNQIPFLNRPLQHIMSILRYMQDNRQEKTEKEVGMYYTPMEKPPFDPLSKKQMEIYGGIFTIESNAEALLKNEQLSLQQIGPISTGRHLGMIPKNIVNPQPLDSQSLDSQSLDPLLADPQLADSQPYSSPIGPLTFLVTTVPQAPDPNFVDFLQTCSK
jgi:hypothetical protein